MFSSSAPFISTMRFPQSFLQPYVSAGHFYSRAFPPAIFQPYIPAIIFTAVYSRGHFYCRAFPPAIFQPYIPAGHFYCRIFPRLFFSRTFPPAIFQPCVSAAIFTAVRFRGHSYCLTLKCTPSCSAIFLQFSIFSSPITSTTLRMVYIPSAAAERAKSSIML